MKDFISCLLLFALLMLCLYYERKEEKWKEHERWLYDSERTLRNISDRFERECFKETENAFEKYTWNVRVYEWHCTLEENTSLVLSKHQHTIDNLEKHYIENLAEKYSNGYTYRKIDGLPDYLKEEYYQRIKDIASRYRHINFTMMMRIRTLSPEYIKETKIEDN